jgi:hypothetical protein
VVAAQILSDMGVEALLTGVVGPNAFPALKAARIRVYEGASDADTGTAALAKFSTGTYREASGPSGGWAGDGAFGAADGKHGAWSGVLAVLHHRLAYPRLSGNVDKESQENRDSDRVS